MKPRKRLLMLAALGLCLLTAGCANDVSRAVRNLRDPKPQVRREAATLLGVKRDPQGVEPLLAALKDSDPGVRRAAATALGTLGDTRAILPLTELLGDGGVSPEDEPHYTTFKKHFELSVRAAAATALVQIGPATAEPLLATLNDRQKSGLARSGAAYALSLLKEERAIPTLIAAARNDEQPLGPDGAEALGRIGGPAVPPLLAAIREEATGKSKIDVSEGGPFQLARALGMTRQEPAIVAALQLERDRDPRLHHMGLIALGFSADPRAIQPLVRALKRGENDSESDVERSLNAQRGLVKLGAPAIPALLEVIRKDDESRRNLAEMALGDMPIRDVLGPLESLLADSNPRAVRSGARALAYVTNYVGDPDAAGLQKAAALLEEGFRKNDLRVVAGGAWYFIKQGGREATILEALQRYGDEDMAYRLLNSGNPQLQQAARKWSRANGYVVCEGVPGTECK